MGKEREIVILLHGIGHTRLHMASLEKALKRKGYSALNITYPSLRNDIPALSEWLARKLEIKEIWQRFGRVHFVTHSMGGIVAGLYLDRHRAGIPDGKMGRVVMLGPPHGGSEVADFLQSNPLYRLAFGPAGQQLTTSKREKEKTAPWYELGIVAGTCNWFYPLGMYCIREANDGCVSVSSTRLEGMKDHIVLPVLHGFMNMDPYVHRQVLKFLEEGSFSRREK